MDRLVRGRMLARREGAASFEAAREEARVSACRTPTGLDPKGSAARGTFRGGPRVFKPSLQVTRSVSARR